MLLDALGDELVLTSLVAGPWPGQKVHRLTAIVVLQHGFRDLGESQGVTWKEHWTFSVWRPGFWLRLWLGEHLILVEVTILLHKGIIPVYVSTSYT